MSRRLNSDYRTKIRNPARRIRQLKQWSELFADYYPVLDDKESYWNLKIPFEINLVQGKYSTKEIKAQCAQYLINVCAHFM